MINLGEIGHSRRCVDMRVKESSYYVCVFFLEEKAQISTLRIVAQGYEATLVDIFTNRTNSGTTHLVLVLGLVDLSRRHPVLQTLQ